MCIGTGGEGRHLLVPHVQPPNATMAPHRVGEAVQAVRSTPAAARVSTIWSATAWAMVYSLADAVRSSRNPGRAINQQVEGYSSAEFRVRQHSPKAVRSGGNVRFGSVADVVAAGEVG